MKVEFAKENFRKKWRICDVSVYHQAPVVRTCRRLDNATHRINRYPVGSVVCFVDTYPLDKDLSGDSVIQPSNNQGQMYMREYVNRHRYLLTKIPENIRLR